MVKKFIFSYYILIKVNLLFGTEELKKKFLLPNLFIMVNGNLRGIIMFRYETRQLYTMSIRCSSKFKTA